MSLEVIPQSGHIDLVIGCIWGDEGKGLETDRRADSGEYSATVRFNGGSNAGHENDQVTLHQIPSGVTHKGILAISSTGVLLDPVRLVDEIDEVRSAGFSITPDNYKISDTCHLVLPGHIIRDALREAGSHAQNSTKRGIGPSASDKYGRENARPELLQWDPDLLRQIVIDGIHKANLLVRESDLSPHIKHGLIETDPEAAFSNWLNAARQIKPYLTDTTDLVHELLVSGKNILAEGAQSIGLDIEQGAYPLNSSSHATPGGALNGLGVGHQYLRKVIGVVKIPTSRVGGENGAFVTMVPDEAIASALRGKRGDKDGEFGKSTNRPRGMGYPDIPMIRRAVRVAGITELVLTKLDVVPRYGREIKVAVAYEMGGQTLQISPNSAIKLKACKPVYQTFKNWHENISEVRNYDDLPDEAKTLVEFIENEAGIPVTRLGVGPQRDQVIVRE